MQLHFLILPLLTLAIASPIAEVDAREALKTGAKLEARTTYYCNLTDDNCPRQCAAGSMYINCGASNVSSLESTKSTYV